MMLSESLCTYSLPYEIVHGAGGWKEGAGSRAGSWREALGSLPEPTGCPGRAGPRPASPQGSSLQLQYLLLPSSWSVGVKNELVLAGWLPKIASPAVRGHFNVKPGVTSAELLKFTVPFFPPLRSLPTPRSLLPCLPLNYLAARWVCKDLRAGILLVWRCLLQLGARGVED